MQQITTVPQGAASLHGRVPGDLLHPRLIRVNGDSGDIYPAAFKMDEKQHVVGRQPAQRQHLRREKVGPRQQRQVGPNEGLPCGRALALRCRRQSVTSQNISHRLIGNLIPEIGQGADNPVIAPGAVLLGHANNQFLNCPLDPGSAWASMLRAIELARDEPSVPSRMVSGRAAVATSPSALRPSRRPISPSFTRSASESFGRPFNWPLRIWFSAARYSFRSSSSWSTVPLM